MIYQVDSSFDLNVLKKQYMYVSVSDSDTCLHDIFQESWVNRFRYLEPTLSLKFHKWIVENNIDFKFFLSYVYEDIHFLFKTESDRTLFLLTWK